MRDTIFYINRFKAMRKEIDFIIADLEEQAASECDWITQREASKLLGVCDATVSNWVKGGRFKPQDISCVGSKTYINKQAILNRRFAEGV